MVPYVYLASLLTMLRPGQVLVEVVNRSSDAAKQALVGGKGLAILGDWLLESATTGLFIYIFV